MLDSIRLNKFIASNGRWSRRKADALIEEGKVKVNGKPAEMGMRVTEKDKVEVLGKPIKTPKNHITIALNKTAGTICSKSDPHNSDTVFRLLPSSFKSLKPAGRLDKESEGLLILSTNGALIQRITHPRHAHKKVYEVIIKGYPKEEDLRPLTTGRLKLDGYKLNRMEFEIMGTLKGFKTRIKLTLTEGRKRQIRRVMDQLGFPVIHLKRTAIGNFELGDLPLGKHTELTPEDIKLLFET